MKQLIVQKKNKVINFNLVYNWFILVLRIYVNEEILVKICNGNGNERKKSELVSERECNKNMSCYGYVKEQKQLL